MDSDAFSNAKGWTNKLNALNEIRNLKLHKPELVLKFGAALLTKHKWRLGNDYWSVCEDVFYASLDTLSPEWTEFTIKSLRRQFGQTARVMRMEGILFEHSGKFNEAMRIYEEMLIANPLDASTWKRKIALYRTTGKIDDAINTLNTYLETFQADTEAWEELADIYLANQHFSQAAYCYEEIVLSSPENCWVILKYAEILYSIGTVEKVMLARKYFIQAIILNKQCTRAMWGLYQCCNFIKGGKPDDANAKLLEKAKTLLQKAYQGSSIILSDFLPIS